MSYILDALKKAEAERRQEKVPGIHSQPLYAPAVPSRESPWRHPAIWIATAIAITATLVATIWLKPWQSPSVSTPTSPPSVSPIVQAPTPTPVVAPPAAATPPVPTPSAAAATPPVPTPSAAPAPTAIQPPNADARPTAAVDTATTKPVPHREPKSQSRTLERPAAAAAPASAESRVPSLRELPESIQREIPELKVGGYIYADKPADRSVIINNRLLREGDEAAPGVTLESMQQHGMTLRYKEYRFRSPY